MAGKLVNNILAFIKKIFRLLVKLAFFFFILMVLLVILLYIPPIQSFVTKKTETTLSDKFNGEVQIGALNLHLFGNLILKDISIRDSIRNEVIQLEKIDVEVSIIPIIYKTIHLDHIEIKGLKSSLQINSDSSTTNLDFIIKAFTNGKPAKKTNSKSWNISYGQISIEESFISLHILRKLNLVVDIGEAKILDDDSDINKLDLKVNHISLKDSEVSLEIFKDSLSSNQIKEEPPKSNPEIQRINVISSIGQIEVSNFIFKLNLKDQFHLLNEIPEFQSKSLYFNLVDQDISASDLFLVDSKTEIAFYDKIDPSPIEIPKEPSNNVLFIKNFGWNINSSRAELKKCSVKYDDYTSPDSSQSLNMNHFMLDNINGSLTDAILANQNLEGTIKKFSLEEKNGFSLKDFNGQIQYKDDKMVLNSLSIKTAYSNLEADISIFKEHFENILNDPKEGKFDIDLRNLSIGAEDLNYFLYENYFADRNIQNLKLSSIANGHIHDFQVDRFELNIDDGILGNVNGRVQNILKPEIICLENINVEVHIKTPILFDIIDSLDNNDLNLPEEIFLEGKINGCYNSLIAESQLRSSAGTISLFADYKKADIEAEDSLSILVDALGLELGHIFKIDSLGPLYIRNEAVITGLNGGAPNIELKGQLDSLILNHKVLKNINYSSSYDSKNIDLNIDSDDSLINLSFKGKGVFEDSLLSFQADLNLTNLDVWQLGYSRKPIKLSANIKTEERVGNRFIDGSVEINDLLIISENTFNYDTVKIDLYKNGDNTSFNILSDVIIGQFSSDIPLNTIGERISEFYSYHFLDSDSIYDIENSGYLNFGFSSKKSLEHLILLVPGLDEFQFSKLEGEINGPQGTSNIDISIPRITYQNILFDSISFKMASRSEQLDYEFNIPGISKGNTKLHNLKLSGKTDSGSVNNIISLKDQSDTILIRVGFMLSHAFNDLYTFQIDPDSLIINSNLWSVKGESVLSFDKDRNIYGNIHIENDQQSFFIVASDTLYEINIADVQLANLSKLLQSFNPDYEISGQLNLESNILLRSENLTINSKISVSDFIFQDTHFGNINAEIGNNEENVIIGELILNNGGNNLSINGNYNQSNTRDPISADISIQFNEISAFQSFAGNLLSKPQGQVHGNVSLIGNKDNLKSNGDLNFESIQVLFTPVDNSYRIEKEKISIEDNKFIFNDFTLLDSANNGFVINGSVHTEQFTEYNMDVRLNADRFTVYNVNRIDNPNFYGSLIISMDAAIKGELDNPNILVNLNIDRGTNLTYSLPPKDFDLVDSDGIVEFVSLLEVDTVQELGFEQYIGDTIFSKMNWIDLNSVLTIDKEAQFIIDIDPVSGDYVQFGGTGNLNLVVQKDQKPQITGNYVFDRGLYQVSFYGLVKKSFEFQQGSSIIWSGDPYNAQLNLSADYNIRTASIGLVSREIYGMSDEEKSQYRRALPYSVEIKINGQLDKPEIGFGIDLEEEEKRGFPLIETKLVQLNEPGNESELTRQVFGLLTIGSFIPETTGPGSTSEFGSALATTAAANSLNSILTNELNKLSGKYITFADLDIGMQTFSDMSGGVQTNRTTMDIKLSKKLFNDRVTIEAQSSFDVHNEADKYNHSSDQSNVHSDFAIIYDLTEKGDYKLKAFERTAYDIIYKDTRLGGIAVIFIKEFDTYKKERKSNK